MAATGSALALLVLFLGSGCIDYSLTKPDTIEGVDDTGPTGTDGGADTGAGPCGPPEVSATVGLDEDCLVDAEPGIFDPVIEWHTTEWDDRGDSEQVIAAPVIGHLDDDNADGHVGLGDVPDIVIVTHDGSSLAQGILRSLDGRTGTSRTLVVGAYPDDLQVFPYRYATPAIGDIDGDGLPEIATVVTVLGGDPGPGDDGGGVDSGSDPGDGGGDDGLPDDNPIGPTPPPVQDMSCGLAAFEADGTLAWVTRDPPLDCAGHSVVLADLEGDGDVEVMVGNRIYQGADGGHRVTGGGDEGRHPAYVELGSHSAVADLDGDGQQELISGRSRYSADGSAICTGDGPTDGFTGIADLDLDGEGEWVVVGNGRVDVYDTDCATLASWTLAGGGNGGPPTISDLDGDGAPEIGVCSAAWYATYEADGELIWRQDVLDESSHATGSVIFDFESDGMPEVVYADEEALYVFDGATGEILLRSEEHTSRTLHDYPPVADVDGDGSAEIIVPNGGGHYGVETEGVYALGSASGSWQAGRQVWNQHAFSITNVTEDMGIPAVPEPNWPTHNSFRSGDPNPVSGGAWPDAVALAEVCTAECGDGRVVVDIALGNQGAAALRAGVPIVAWVEAADGTIEVVTETWTPTVISPGEVGPVVRLRVAAEAVADGTLYVGVDRTAEGIGVADECVEDNNIVLVSDAACP